MRRTLALALLVVAAPASAASVGSNCTIIEGAPLATTSAGAAEATSSLAKKDFQNLAAMMGGGRLVLLKKAAMARVITKESGMLHVRVLDPGAFGLERWVAEALCK